MEIDNHADTTVLGRNCLSIHDYNRPVDVSGWDASQGSVECPTISGAVAYDHPITGQVYILVYHQAIHCKSLENHLMCPMQSRVTGVKINELPKFLADKPDDETHAIVVGNPLDTDESLIIPLMIKGVTSYFPTRKPSMREYEDDNIQNIAMTSELPDWEPSEADFAEQEAGMTDFRGQVLDRETIERGRSVISSVSTGSDINGNDIISIDFTADNNFGNALADTIKVSRVGVSKGKVGVTAQRLSKNWNISPEAAKRTVERTTQRGVRTTLNPSLSRRYSTQDRFLRYNRLQHDMFTDTMKSNVISRRKNEYSQMYCTNFGWARAHSMKSKGEAHDTVSLVFKRDGVPPKMIMDGSKEQSRGLFQKKCREADCHVRVTEPYSPWQQQAEGTIREVKKGAGRKMVRSGCPKRLWDDAIEFEAYVRSHTALDIYSLRGEVPETLMTGNTADISKYCEHGFYDFIMFRDDKVKYPDDNPVLGRWLGPAIDVGSSMVAYIMKENGEVVCRSTYRALNELELASDVHLKKRQEYDEAIRVRYGPSADPTDFPQINLEDTPTYDMYEDANTTANNNEDGLEGSPDDELPINEVIPTPEANDNYVNASIVLPRGNGNARGTVVSRKRDADGNVVGRANDNPILDTREYHIKFDDGEVSELTANVIAESMYASCDADGNEYLLIDSIVDYRKNDKALSLEDQKIVTSDGKKARRRSTAGYQLCIQWKDGSTSWQSLKDMKDSHPIQTAEYAIAQEIDHEPGFNWWVNAVLNKRERVLYL